MGGEREGGERDGEGHRERELRHVQDHTMKTLPTCETLAQVFGRPSACMGLSPWCHARSMAVSASSWDLFNQSKAIEHLRTDCPPSAVLSQLVCVLYLITAGSCGAGVLPLRRFLAEGGKKVWR